MVNLKTYASTGMSGYIPYVGATAAFVTSHNIKIDNTSKLEFGAGSSGPYNDYATIYWDGNNLKIDAAGGIDFNTAGGSASTIDTSAMNFDMAGDGTTTGIMRARRYETQDLGGNDYFAYYMGSGDDSLIGYDGTDVIFKSDVVGTGNVKFSNNIHLDDSKLVSLGTGDDSSLADDGTNMLIDTDVQGAGPTTDTRNLIITGAVINPITVWAHGDANATAAGGNIFRMPASGRAVTVSTITDGTVGQIITLIGSAVNYTFNETGNIVLGGFTTSRLISTNDILQFVFEGTKWLEIGWNNI